MSPWPLPRSALPTAIFAARSFFVTVFRDGLAAEALQIPSHGEALRNRDVETLADIFSAYPLYGTSPQFPAAREAIREMMLDSTQLFEGQKDHGRSHVRNMSPRRLRQIRVPCLTIIGEREVPLLLHESQAIARDIVSSETIVAPQNTRWMSLEEPERFTKIVLDWLASQGL